LSESPLTYTQHQILVRIADGLTNRAIGNDLHLSVNTTKEYVRRIFHKLGARDRANAVAIGYQRGLLGHEVSAVIPVPIPAPEPIPAPLILRSRRRVSPAIRQVVSVGEVAVFRRAIGGVLRTRREELGWTQDETAGLVGISASVLSRLERNARNGRDVLDANRLVLLCAHLGIAPVDAVQQAQDKAFPQGWPHTDPFDSEPREHHGN